MMTCLTWRTLESKVFILHFNQHFNMSWGERRKTTNENWFKFVQQNGKEMVKERNISVDSAHSKMLGYSDNAVFLLVAPKVILSLNFSVGGFRSGASGTPTPSAMWLAPWCVPVLFLVWSSYRCSCMSKQLVELMHQMGMSIKHPGDEGFERYCSKSRNAEYISLTLHWKHFNCFVEFVGKSQMLSWLLSLSAGLTNIKVS